MTPSPGSTKPWWGAFPLTVDAPRRWEIGPLSLQVARFAREIRVWHWRDADPLDPRCVVGAEAPGDPPDHAELARFGFEQSPDVLHVVPVLADRALVTQPEDPFHLPPRESATIYVSCPLWLQLRSRADGPEYFEVPIHRPSDTWFGPNTRVGELCYASRTAARLNLENVVFLPQRAVAAVEVSNRSSRRLDLERLKLPTPFLSLHATESGRLWTEKITLRRDGDGDGEAAVLDLDREPPPQAGATTFVNGPRTRPARGDLLRAFGRMVGRGGQHV